MPQWHPDMSILLVYCVVTRIGMIKIASAKIVVEIPLDIALGIVNEISKEMDVAPDVIHDIKKKIEETIKNPYALFI